VVHFRVPHACVEVKHHEERPRRLHSNRCHCDRAVVAREASRRLLVLFEFWFMKPLLLSCAVLGLFYGVDNATPPLSCRLGTCYYLINIRVNRSFFNTRKSNPFDTTSRPARGPRSHRQSTRPVNPRSDEPRLEGSSARDRRLAHCATGHERSLRCTRAKK